MSLWNLIPFCVQPCSTSRRTAEREEEDGENEKPDLRYSYEASEWMGQERVTSEEINSSYQIFVIIFNIHASLHLSLSPRAKHLLCVLFSDFLCYWLVFWIISLVLAGIKKLKTASVDIEAPRSIEMIFFERPFTQRNVIMINEKTTKFHDGTMSCLKSQKHRYWSFNRHKDFG